MDEVASEPVDRPAQVDPTWGAAGAPPALAGAEREPVPPGPLPRSGWRELRANLPELLRLCRDLVADPRVPVRAKVIVAAALGYAVLPLGRTPLGRLPGISRGYGLGADDLAAIVFAVRHLVTAAGYDVVRELWTGTDAAFGWVVVLTGVAE